MSCADTADSDAYLFADDTVSNNWEQTRGEVYTVSNWHSEDRGYLLAGESDAAITRAISRPPWAITVLSPEDVTVKTWGVLEFASTAPDALTAIVPLAEKAGWTVFPSEENVFCSLQRYMPQTDTDTDADSDADQSETAVVFQKRYPLIFNGHGVARLNLSKNMNDSALFQALNDGNSESNETGGFAFSLLKAGPGEVHISQINLYAF